MPSSYLMWSILVPLRYSNDAILIPHVVDSCTTPLFERCHPHISCGRFLYHSAIRTMPSSYLMCSILVPLRYSNDAILIPHVVDSCTTPLFERCHPHTSCGRFLYHSAIRTMSSSYLMWSILVPLRYSNDVILIPHVVDSCTTPLFERCHPHISCGRFLYHSAIRTMSSSYLMWSILVPLRYSNDVILIPHVVDSCTTPLFERCHPHTSCGRFLYHSAIRTMSSSYLMWSILVPLRYPNDVILVSHVVDSCTTPLFERCHPHISCVRFLYHSAIRTMPSSYLMWSILVPLRYSNDAILVSHVVDSCTTPLFERCHPHISCGRFLYHSAIRTMSSSYLMWSILVPLRYPNDAILISHVVDSCTTPLFERCHPRISCGRFLYHHLERQRPKFYLRNF